MASQPASPNSATSAPFFATQTPASPESDRPGTAHLSASEHEGTTEHRMKAGLDLPAFELLAKRIGPDKAAHVATRLMYCNGDDFKSFDADGGGTITKWEMMAMFRQALFIRKHELSDADIDAIYAVIDKDRSGSITLPEFLEFVTGGQSKGGKDEKLRAQKGAELQLGACALHKKGKLEDCIVQYEDSLRYTTSKRARFVTLNNLANALISRAATVRPDARSSLFSQTLLPTPAPVRDRSTVARARVPVRARALGTPGQGRRAQPAPARARDVARGARARGGRGRPRARRVQLGERAARDRRALRGEEDVRAHAQLRRGRPVRVQGAHAARHHDAAHGRAAANALSGRGAGRGSRCLHAGAAIPAKRGGREASLVRLPARGLAILGESNARTNAAARHARAPRAGAAPFTPRCRS